MNTLEGWHTRRFDEFGTLLSGSTPSTSIRGFWDGEIVWVTPYDLSRLKSPYLYDTAKKITKKGLEGCSTQLLPAKSIVMSSRAPIGYVAIPRVDFCTNQGCKSIKLKSGYDSEFAYYNILFNIGKVKTLGEGTTFAEISKSALSAVELDFPDSKPEQTKIAEVLSTVDRAIEQTEALIAKQQRIKTGLMQDLLTKGIDEHGNLRSEATHAFKDSPLGRIPVEWDIVALRKSCDVIDSLHRTPRFSEDGYPMVRVTDINGGALLLERCETVASHVYGEFTCNHRPKRGDIVMSRVGTYGISSYVDTDKDFCIGQNTVVITGFLNPIYLFEFLQTRMVRDHFEMHLAGSSQKTLSLKAIRETPIPILRVGEMKLIAQILDSETKMIAHYWEALEKLCFFKAALMQDLLTGKKRVTPLLEAEAH